MSSVFLTFVDATISVPIQVDGMTWTVRKSPPKSLKILRSYAAFVLLALCGNSIFVPRWGVIQKNPWKIFTTWLALFMLSPYMLDLMGLVQAIEWIGLIYIHLFGLSAHHRPFNRFWAKDLLAAKMIGSYWLGLFHCRIIPGASPLVPAFLVVLLKNFWESPSATQDPTHPCTALILHPGSELQTMPAETEQCSIFFSPGFASGSISELLSIVIYIWFPWNRWTWRKRASFISSLCCKLHFFLHLFSAFLSQHDGGNLAKLGTWFKSP